MSTSSDALDVAVAVVSYDTCDLLGRCLESVRAAGPREVVVVDNGSTDGSIALVRDRFPEVRLVVRERNGGYGAAANQAVAACAAPVVLLLNSDTELEPGALGALGRYLARHPRAAVVGPRLVGADGVLQPSTLPLPTVADMVVGDTGLHLVLRRLPRLRERFLRTWAHDRPRAVPWVNGAALALRRVPFEQVGGFDERYFMYWEEADLARRLARAGHETHFAPVTTVRHVRSASTRKQPVAMRRAWLVSYRRYLATHATPRSRRAQLGLLRALARARCARAAGRQRLTRDPERRRALAASVADWRALLAEEQLWRP